MRARLLLKLIGMVVFLVLTAMTARACTGSSSPSSPLDPANLARNGVASICADQAAAAQDGEAPATAMSPAGLAQEQASDPAGVRALQQALGGNLSCPTTTTVATDGG